MARWQFNLCQLQPDGTVDRICSIPTGTFVEWEQDLNGTDHVYFSVSLEDPALLLHGLDQELVMLYEAEAWRNGVLVCAGPLLTLDLDTETGSSTFHLVSWWHYFHRRYFGRADRINLLSNGDFDVDFTDWSDFGTGMTSKTIDSSVVAEGTASAKLIGTSNHTGGITQTLASTITHSYGPGLPLYLNLECQVDTAANVNFGRVPGQGTTVAELQIDWAGGSFTQPINLQQGFGTSAFGRLITGVLLAAGVTYTVTVRLYAIDGIIWWDAGQVFFRDSTTVTYPSQDQAVLFSNVLSYAQDPSSGKSDLGVAISAPSTTVQVLLGYPHEAHENIGDAIIALTQRVNGFDFHCDYPNRTVVLDYPQRGAVKVQWSLALARQLAKLQLTIDGSQVETSHVVLGNPQFSEEGGAVDTSSYNGLILEGVTRAPVSYTLRELDHLAEEALRQRATPMLTPSITVNQASGDLAGSVVPGDVLPVQVQRGWLDLAVNLRVVTLIEHADESVTLTFAQDAAVPAS